MPEEHFDGSAASPIGNQDQVHVHHGTEDDTLVHSTEDDTLVHGTEDDSSAYDTEDDTSACTEPTDSEEQSAPTDKTDETQASADDDFETTLSTPLKSAVELARDHSKEFDGYVALDQVEPSVDGTSSNLGVVKGFHKGNPVYHVCNQY